jgi:hypothetical protein
MEINESVKVKLLQVVDDIIFFRRRIRTPSKQSKMLYVEQILKIVYPKRIEEPNEEISDLS